MNINKVQNIEENSFLVGGAVRDILMGIEPKDQDFVVVGKTTQDMLDAGFSQVGNDFPVFIHPNNGFEYALARSEKKNGIGYNGFEVLTEDVSLEEDLFRRDLTINAMAMDKNKKIIDPFNGQNDLKNKKLKHVSIHFAEDPLRVLRVARFAARYNFDIDPSTLLLMKKISDSKEITYLSQERIFKEFEKVINEPFIEKFFISLEQSNTLEQIGNFSRENFENINDKSVDYRLGKIFFHFSQKQMREFKLPSDFIEKIELFKAYFNNPYYNTYSPEEKLMFIKKHKSLHDISSAKNTLKILLSEENFEIAFNILSEDIVNLKSINYESFQKDKDIKNVILNEQIKAISKTPKFRP